MAKCSDDEAYVDSRYFDRKVSASLCPPPVAAKSSPFPSRAGTLIFVAILIHLYFGTICLLSHLTQLS
jgi:hypothetical protein